MTNWHTAHVYSCSSCGSFHYYIIVFDERTVQRDLVRREYGNVASYHILLYFCSQVDYKERKTAAELLSDAFLK